MGTNPRYNETWQDRFGELRCFMQSLNSIPIPSVPISSFFDDNADFRPAQIRWNRDEYYKMAELGFFDGKRVELIEGEIIEMAPMGSPHITCIMILGRLLTDVFSKGYCVRTQGTLDLGLKSQPEPDAAVVAGALRDYADAHPKSAVLIVEVSDTTLSLDRTFKAAIYARNSIEDYWIVNLQHRCVEIYRKPVQDSNLGFIYSERTVIGEKESVSPLAKPKAKIKVADILP